MPSLLAIYIATSAKAKTIALDKAELQAGRGIVGDRYHPNNPSNSVQVGGRPDQEITLIEAEQIDRFNAGQAFLFSYGYGDFRRNLVTQGLDLNALVGKRFKVGEAELQGLRLCEPCGRLAKIIGQEVLKHMVHKAGLRAKIVSGGVVMVGDNIHPM